MSKWGIYDHVSPPHVMPVDDNMHAINGHTVSDQCWCKPHIEHGSSEELDVIVHHDVGRGGCDA